MRNKCHCKICPMAKLYRLPFPIKQTTSQFPFQLVHCDIWGLDPTPSLNNSQFFLTIVSDFTICTWVFLMKHKSETIII